MDKNDFIKKIISKKEFSQLPKKDVEIALDKFYKRQTSDEEKIKLTRDFLRKTFSAFTSGKLLNPKILDRKSPEEILRKHISTKERFDYYSELYEKILESFEEKEISILDFGSGINGISYAFFPNSKKINYIGVEAVGQLNNLVNRFFKKNNFINAKSFHGSLFDLDFVKEKIQRTKHPRIVFLFKVLDSLESVERNYSKKFLKELIEKVDLVVVSFAMRSLVSRKNFCAKRYWFDNFVKENFQIVNNFEFGSEKYILFKKR